MLLDIDIHTHLYVELIPKYNLNNIQILVLYVEPKYDNNNNQNPKGIW